MKEEEEADFEQIWKTMEKIGRKINIMMRILIWKKDEWRKWISVNNSYAIKAERNNSSVVGKLSVMTQVIVKYLYRFHENSNKKGIANKQQRGVPKVTGWEIFLLLTGKSNSFYSYFHDINTSVLSSLIYLYLFQEIFWKISWIVCT